MARSNNFVVWGLANGATMVSHRLLKKHYGGCPVSLAKHRLPKSDTIMSVAGTPFVRDCDYQYFLSMSDMGICSQLCERNFDWIRALYGCFDWSP